VFSLLFMHGVSCCFCPKRDSDSANIGSNPCPSANQFKGLTATAGSPFLIFVTGIDSGYTVKKTLTRLWPTVRNFSNCWVILAGAVFLTINSCGFIRQSLLLARSALTADSVYFLLSDFRLFVENPRFWNKYHTERGWFGSEAHVPQYRMTMAIIRLQ